MQLRTWLDAYPFVDRATLLEASEGGAERWRSLLGDGRPTFVAEVDGAIVGIMSAAASRDEDGDGVGELWMLYVAPEAQGQGIGAALNAAGEDELRRLWFAEATVWVFAENARARAFYEHVGWTLDGAAKPDAWGPEVRYRKAL